jgi:GT2 family glycosyltransferase
MTEMLALDGSGTDCKNERAPSRTRGATGILAIVVLYGTPPRECGSMRSLLKSLAHVSEEDLRLKILLYDNTPGGQDPGTLPANAEYLVAPGNYGLASAYNVALKIAVSQGYKWLLSLDQDTELPESFLGRIAGITRELREDTGIAAIVPQVSDQGVLISPHVARLGRSKKLPRNFVGVSKREIEAINSGTVWSTSALEEIGGFDLLFWLDYLDYCTCHMVHRAGKRMYVAGDLKIEHQLSTLDLNRRMSSARFQNYLLAESAFCDLYKGPLDGLVLTAKLMARLAGLTISRKNVKFRRLTWWCLKRRLTQRAITRIEDWREQTSKHLPF